MRKAADERFEELELNISITAMPIDDSGMPDLSITRRFLPQLSDEQLLRTPGVLSGSTSDSRRRDPPLPRHLRGQLHHRAAAARRGVREGDGATALSGSRRNCTC